MKERREGRILGLRGCADTASTEAVSQCVVRVCPALDTDLSQVVGLLWFLDRLYPGGRAWLDRRIHEVKDAKATCMVAKHNGLPVGVAIDTPKGARRAKLSTIYVAPAFRGQGIGRSLLAMIVEGWWRRGVDEAVVTVALERLAELSRLANPIGFRLAAIEQARYGAARDEAVLQWKP